MDYLVRRGNKQQKKSSVKKESQCNNNEKTKKKSHTENKVKCQFKKVLKNKTNCALRQENSKEELKESNVVNYSKIMKKYGEFIDDEKENYCNRGNVKEILPYNNSERRPNFIYKMHNNLSQLENNIYEKEFKTIRTLTPKYTSSAKDEEIGNKIHFKNEEKSNNLNKTNTNFYNINVINEENNGKSAGNEGYFDGEFGGESGKFDGNEYEWNINKYLEKRDMYGGLLDGNINDRSNEVNPNIYAQLYNKGEQFMSSEKDYNKTEPQYKKQSNYIDYKLGKMKEKNNEMKDKVSIFVKLMKQYSNKLSALAELLPVDGNITDPKTNFEVKETANQLNELLNNPRLNNEVFKMNEVLNTEDSNMSTMNRKMDNEIKNYSKEYSNYVQSSAGNEFNNEPLNFINYPNSPSILSSLNNPNNINNIFDSKNELSSYQNTIQNDWQKACFSFPTEKTKQNFNKEFSLLIEKYQSKINLLQKENQNYRESNRKIKENFGKERKKLSRKIKEEMSKQNIWQSKIKSYCSINNELKNKVENLESEKTEDRRIIEKYKEVVRNLTAENRRLKNLLHEKTNVIYYLENSLKLNPNTNIDSGTLNNHHYDRRNVKLSKSFSQKNFQDTLDRLEGMNSNNKLSISEEGNTLYENYKNCENCCADINTNTLNNTPNNKGKDCLGDLEENNIIPKIDDFTLQTLAVNRENDTKKEDKIIKRDKNTNKISCGYKNDFRIFNNKGYVSNIQRCDYYSQNNENNDNIENDIHNNNEKLNKNKGNIITQNSNNDMNTLDKEIICLQSKLKELLVK